MSSSDENKDYFLALQKIIEEMVEKAGEPVVLIAHSMGNLYTLYFLNQQPQAWKDRYIKAFVSLGAPWAGVVKTLRVVISGKRRTSITKKVLIYMLLTARHSHKLCASAPEYCEQNIFGSDMLLKKKSLIIGLFVHKIKTVNVM